MCPALPETIARVSSGQDIDGDLLQARDTAKEDVVRACLELFKQRDSDTTTSALTAVAVADPDLALRLAIEGDVPLSILGKAFGCRAFATRQSEAFKQLSQPSGFDRKLLESSIEGCAFLALLESPSTARLAPPEITNLVERYVTTEIRGRTLKEFAQERLPDSELRAIQRALEHKDRVTPRIYSVKGQEFRLPPVLDSEVVSGVLLRELAKKADLAPSISKYLAQLEESTPNLCEGRFRSAESLLKALLDPRPLDMSTYPISKVSSLKAILECRGKWLSEPTLSAFLRSTTECCKFLSELGECDPVTVLRNVEDIIARTTTHEHQQRLARHLQKKVNQLEILKSSLQDESEEKVSSQVVVLPAGTTTEKLQLSQDQRGCVAVQYSLPGENGSGWITLPALETKPGLKPGERGLRMRADFVLVEGPGESKVLRKRGKTARSGWTDRRFLNFL